jgi:hypothetical protein
MFWADGTLCGDRGSLFAKLLILVEETGSYSSVVLSRVIIAVLLPH